MLSLSHPAVRAFLAHHREHPGDRGALCGFCDWLIDHDAAEADLAVLLAGSAPEHQDGIPQEVLALWLECRGRADQARAVRNHRLTRATTFEGWQLTFPPCPRSGLSEPFLLEADARRALLRRLLGLPWAAGVRILPYHDVLLPWFLPYHDADCTGETAAVRAAYRKMLSDENVKAALLGKALAVASLDLKIQPADKRNPRDRRVADFVKWALTERLRDTVPGPVWAVLSLPPGARLDAPSGDGGPC